MLTRSAWGAYAALALATLIASAARAAESPTAALPDVSSAVPTATPAQPSADTVEAARLFNLGLAFVAERHLEDARDAFERAYQLAPHYAVLYNLGLVYLELSQPERAGVVLRQYLSEGADRIPADRRATVTQLLAEGSTSETPLNKPSPQVALPKAKAKRAQADSSPAPSVGAQSLEDNTNAAASKPERAAGPSNSSVARRAIPDRHLAFSFAGFGLGIAGAGIGVLVWSNSKYQDVREKQSSINANPPQTHPKSQSDLQAVIAYEEARGELVSELRFVHTLDAIAYSTLGVGAAVAALGVVFWFTGEAHPVEVGLARGQLQLTGKW